MWCCSLTTCVPLLLLLLLQSVLGNVASVAMGPDGTLWALHRGGRVWDEDTFDTSERITEKDPIAVDVVLQMHPDTGRWCGCKCAA